MHSSRIRTARCSGHLSCHVCPPAMQAPHHACPPCHAGPPACRPPCHAGPPTATHAPLPHMPHLRHMPPAMYAPLPCTPPCHASPRHASPPWTDRHLWKHNLRKLRLRAVKTINDENLRGTKPQLFHSYWEADYNLKGLTVIPFTYGHYGWLVKTISEFRMCDKIAK